MTPLTVETEVRVRYAETDAMQIAHHANYLVWFEQARGDLLRQRGVTYRQLEERGVMLPLSACELRFAAPARYDDVLRVRATLTELRSRQLRIDYVVHHLAGTPAARGRTTHIVVDAATRRPTRMPADILALLAGAAQPDSQ